MSQATSAGTCSRRTSCRRTTYNIAADLPEPAAPAAPSGHQRAVGPADLAPLFPMELIKQEVSAERFIPIPERGARRVPHLPADRRWSGRWAWSGRSIRRPASTTSTRAARPAGSPQAEHGHRAGLLQPRGGRPPPRHRDRRRPVGERARLRRRAVRPGDQGLHGQGQLRAEAVPAQLHPDHGRQRRRRRHPRRRTPAAPSWPRTPTPPAAWASPSARRWRWRPPTRTPSTRWAAC